MKTLYEETISLVINAKGRWPAICKDTGVDYQWLAKFAQKRIKNPGIQRVQTIHDYLKAA